MPCCAAQQNRPVNVCWGSRPCENVFRRGSGATLMQIYALGHILDSPKQRVRFFYYARVILFRVFTQSGSPPEVAVWALMSASTSCGHWASRTGAPCTSLSVTLFPLITC